MKARKPNAMARDMALAKKSKIPPAATRAFVKADMAEDRGMMPMGAPPAPKRKPQVGAPLRPRSRAY